MEEEKKPEMYEIGMICRNCKWIPGTYVTDGIRFLDNPKKFAIPKGTEVKVFLQGMMCEHCGCDGFMGMG